MASLAKRGPAADQLLEAYAAHAGAAMACVYSSSAEYDAALIAERRAAGVYGPRRYRRLDASRRDVSRSRTGVGCKHQHER